MATTAISTRTSETVGRGPWTSHDVYKLFVVLAQACGVVCAGVLLYSLGPGTGIAVLAGGLTVWLTVRGHLASTKKQQHLADEQDQ
jgi:F0F1-type ATP synthase assembly protein I